MLDSVYFVAIQLLALLLVAPLVNGIVRKIKAFTQKRRGAPLLQMYFDLYKLLKKDTVVSETSSWVFKAAPYIVFVTSLSAGLFVPVTLKLQALPFAGDMILAVYLLALGRFFLALSGLDTGSTFGGMGSSREMMISSLMEPSLLVSLFTVGLVTGSTSIYQQMKTVSVVGVDIIQPVFILAFLALFIILLAETARIPVDDPATHLELTMVHEAMILEYSGRHLALMEWGGAVKQLIFITILANLFLPTDGLIKIDIPFVTQLLSLVIYLGKAALISVLVAVAEVSMVKFRLFSVPNLAALSFTLSFLGFVQFFIVGR